MMQDIRELFLRKGNPGDYREKFQPLQRCVIFCVTGDVMKSFITEVNENENLAYYDHKEDFYTGYTMVKILFKDMGKFDLRTEGDPLPSVVYTELVIEEIERELKRYPILKEFREIMKETEKKLCEKDKKEIEKFNKKLRKFLV